MTHDGKTAEAKESWYAWVIVLIAAIAMAATFPGRTHGLGLITKHLLNDFPSLSQQDFGQINLWATLIGAAFCLPCGWLVDRLGIRIMLTAVLGLLAATVLWMSSLRDVPSLVIAITLSRGIGQSMLSVVSITMIGKWFRNNVGLAMGLFSVQMSLLMAAATGIVGQRVNTADWRTGWHQLGVILAIATPVCALLAFDRRGTRATELAPTTSEPSANLIQALSSPCFWVFALSISFFGLVSSGISLWQQLILEERGLTANVFTNVLVIGLLVGMIANLIAGAMARIFRLSWMLAGSMLAGSMLVLGLAYAILPLVRTASQAYGFAVIQGVAGGTLTVVFFSVWRHAFGTLYLGRIQGAAQMITVLASAVGPLIVANSNAAAGTYSNVLFLFAAISAAFALIAWFTPVPSASAGAWRASAVSDSTPQLQQSPA